MKIEKNTGLVLEGGGMRGVFTSGVLDAFMKHGLYFDYVVAVSAGACNGMSYIIDAHILVDPTISVVESHDIASRVEEALTLKFGTETQINIHVEPDMRTNK